ncbi:hypothetical protein LWI28_019150 [Acer negundo]|uniref:Uncharacterized protein n=1 Tax=Acer negundo TaxID=4023 RepID=A0AAD5I7I1_ACENE|nr:hypothetical protein LWI28_019150 [Acer negundo]
MVIKIRVFVEKLLKGFSFLAPRVVANDHEETMVPDDVKEGHFVVVGLRRNMDSNKTELLHSLFGLTNCRKFFKVGVRLLVLVLGYK